MNRRSSFILILSLTAILCTLSLSEAWIIYVAKDNSCPGAGTDANPFCSIQNAFNVVRPGDTVRIRDSASPYDEAALATVEHSGTAAHPITVEPDIHHSPILRYTGNGSTDAVMHLQGVDYWTVQNLTFDGTDVYTSRFAIWVGSNCLKDQVGIRILNNTFKNWGGTEAQTVNTPSPTALIISGGFEPPAGCGAPNGTIIRGNIFDGNRVKALELLSTKNSIVESNEFTNTQCGRDTDGAVNAVGVHLTTGTNNEHTGDIIRNNILHDFVPYSCALTGIGATMAGIWSDVGPKSGIVDGNTIWNLNAGIGVVFSVGIFIEQDSYGWTIIRNVLYNIGTAGMRHNPGLTAASDNRWYNNTLFNTGLHGIEYWSGHADTRNNIIDNASSAQILVRHDAVTQGHLMFDYNDYWNDPDGAKVGVWDLMVGTDGNAVNFSTWKTQCGCDAHSLNANPRFVNPPSNLHLQGSSPARGAGQGGVDMGAYNKFN